VGEQLAVNKKVVGSIPTLGAITGFGTRKSQVQILPH
jgi:hypothetical protein